MPELPEVEALVRFLDERTVGRTVVAADVVSIAALKTVDPPVNALVSRVVRGVDRHGKWLDLDFSLPDAGAPASPRSEDGSPACGVAEVSRLVGWGGGLHLVFHLARGGWLRWSESAPTAPVKPRLGAARGGAGATLAFRLRFDDGSGFSLTEAGTRKRLAVHVVRDPHDVAAIATLGIEPFDPAFTADRLGELMSARNQQVKGLLRDQGGIAGIGNAYSDEILHAARISPVKLTRSFTPADVANLHRAIGEVLAEAVAAASGKPAAELKDAKRRGMRVHARTGEQCPVCGDVVREVCFADRSMQYCATCQTGGRVLADRRMSRLLK